MFVLREESKKSLQKKRSIFNIFKSKFKAKGKNYDN